MKFLKYLKRLKEPSTMAGIAALGLVLGMPEDVMQPIEEIIAGAAGLGAILMPEGKQN